MADQIPPISGAPADAEWFRWAQRGIVDGGRNLDRMALDLGAANKGIAASLASLSEQVSDLQGRVGYSEDGTGTSQAWTSNQPSNAPWGPTLTFTLTTPRVVSIEFAVQAIAQGRAENASTAVFVGLRGMVFVNGEPTPGSRGEIGTIVQIQPSPTIRTAYARGTAVSRSLVSLEAGTHVVQGGFAYRSAEPVGTGSATITASDPVIFVDVLQPGGA